MSGWRLRTSEGRAVFGGCAKIVDEKRKARNEDGREWREGGEEMLEAFPCGVVGVSCSGLELAWTGTTTFPFSGRYLTAFARSGCGGMNTSSLFFLALCVVSFHLPRSPFLLLVPWPFCPRHFWWWKFPHFFSLLPFQSFDVVPFRLFFTGVFFRMLFGLETLRLPFLLSLLGVGPR